MYKLGGWKKSSGNLNVTPFKVSNTLTSLAAARNYTNQHIILEYTPISNQLDIGSCVANATCDCLEVLKGLEDKNNVTQLSRLFVYWNARLYTKETGKDGGCYIHNAMDSLTTLGVCTESLWPYDVNNVFIQPNQLAYKQGDDNTFNYFYQIISDDDDRVKDIEAAIRANHPVVFGTLVGQELMDYIGEEKVFNPPLTSKGGHAMLITGVRINSSGKREFYIRNSWGFAWGIQGHCWFSEEYIKWNETSDIFVGTRVDDLLV